MRALLALLLWPAFAHADAPCDDSVVDPIVTPVRDAQLDGQRGACLRKELSAGLRAHALVDTPGFHGVLGGDLDLGARWIVAKAHELSASLTLFDYTFVQNAVNKVTHTGYGPVVVGAAAGGAIGTRARGALALRVEVPLTDDQMDTVRVGAQLAGLVSGQLARDWILHTRLGALGRTTTSLGGETRRLAFVAGSDLAWQLRRRVVVQAGAEMMAGWDGGLDHVLVRAGVHWRVRGGPWRLRAGVGAPVAGGERTNAILDLTLVVDR